MSDTIAAIATAAARSAIGIIRMSGDNAVQIADSRFIPTYTKSLSDAEPRKLIYGSLTDEHGAVLDICLCTVSFAPHSYTGENTVEFQCHGSPVVLEAGLRSLFTAGARQALPGEFTKRAFLNGCMDLTQAESVIDLIDAETADAARNAAGQLGGAIAKKADSVYNSLLDILAHFHAIIDYPDEELEPFRIDETLASLQAAYKTLFALGNTFEQGRILRDGVRSAIVGKPNVGKSSLLNALLGYERAIVTPMAGTTRDTIEEKVLLGGVLLRLSDTAGIRYTGDLVESIGVSRAKDAARDAELVLAVFDGSQSLSDEDMESAKAAVKSQHAIAVINKSDLTQRLDTHLLKPMFSYICAVSAKDYSGLDALGRLTAKIFQAEVPAPAGEIITNARQAGAIERALSALRSAVSALEQGVTPDAVLTEVEAAMEAIGELCGRTVRSDITSRIFERFCVGK